MLSSSRKQWFPELQPQDEEQEVDPQNDDGDDTNEEQDEAEGDEGGNVLFTGFFWGSFKDREQEVKVDLESEVEDDDGDNEDENKEKQELDEDDELTTRGSKAELRRLREEIKDLCCRLEEPLPWTKLVRVNMRNKIEQHEEYKKDRIKTKDEDVLN